MWGDLSQDAKSITCNWGYQLNEMQGNAMFSLNEEYRPAAEPGLFSSRSQQILPALVPKVKPEVKEQPHLSQTYGN